MSCGYKAELWGRSMGTRAAHSSSPWQQMRAALMLVAPVAALVLAHAAMHLATALMTALMAVAAAAAAAAADFRRTFTIV